MFVIRALGYATRRTTGMVFHPRRTTAELLADAGQVLSSGSYVLSRAAKIIAIDDDEPSDGVAPLRSVKSDIPRARKAAPESSPKAAARAKTAPEDEAADEPVDILDRPRRVPTKARAAAATPKAKPTPPKTPRTARKVEEEVVTHAGTAAAGAGVNPSTGEPVVGQDEDDEPLIDPGVAKAVESESAMMRKAASTDK